MFEILYTVQTFCNIALLCDETSSTSVMSFKENLEKKKRKTINPFSPFYN